MRCHGNAKLNKINVFLAAKLQAMLSVSIRIVHFYLTFITYIILNLAIFRAEFSDF